MLSNFSQELQLFGSVSQAFGPDQSTFGTDMRKLIRPVTMRATSEVQNKEPEEFPCCLIHPDKSLKKVWNVILTMLLIYTATVMPYRMAFIESVMWDDWFIAELIIDILFFTDFIVNCLSAYYNSDGVLVVDRKQIMISYARSWMFLDIVACLPFQLLESVDGGSEAKGWNNFLRLVRLPRLYRLVRISRIFKILQTSRHQSTLLKIQDFFRLNNSAIRLASIFITVIIMAHIIACLWFFVARMEGFNPDTWVVRSGHIDDDDSIQYVAALYWTYTTMSTVGYGDILAQTLLEKLLAIAIMIFGVCFFSFTIGSLASIFNRMDSKEAVLNNKMLLIDEFSKEARLSKELKIRLRHALQYSTDKTGFSWNDKQNIFNELPKVLRYEVAMAMHHGAAKKIPFFRGRDQVFVSTIVPFLQHLQKEDGEYVYMENEYADEMYFIIKGKVQFVYGRDCIVFKSLSKGSYFGEIEVIQQIPRKYTVQAAEEINLLIMNRGLVFQILADFPNIAHELRDIAELRDTINSKARRELIQRLNGESNESERGEVPAKAPKKAKPAENLNEFTIPDIIRKVDKLEVLVSKLAASMAQTNATQNEKITMIEDKVMQTTQVCLAAISHGQSRSNIVLPPLQTAPVLPGHPEIPSTSRYESQTRENTADQIATLERSTVDQGAAIDVNRMEEEKSNTIDQIGTSQQVLNGYHSADEAESDRSGRMSTYNSINRHPVF